MHTCESGDFWKKPPHITRLILVRHGETDWNQQKRFQGHMDIPLNTRGIEQAYLLRARLERIAHSAGVPIGQLYTECFTSDLGRAHHTAKVLHGAHPSPITATQTLRERHYGHLSGMTGDEMQAHNPEEFKGLKERIPHAPLTGGESLQTFYTRIITYVQNLIKQHPAQTLLLVAHGGVLDCIYRLAKQEPLSITRSWLLPNCAINVVDWHTTEKGEGFFTVPMWADVNHLLEDAGDEVDGRVT